MHWSGAATVAGALAECGVYGITTRERREIATLNEDVLSCSGGACYSPPTKLSWSPLHKTTRDLILESYNNVPLWYMTEPCTTLLLDGWMDSIPHGELICVFTHPFLAADSLRKANSISYAEGLEKWVTYNRILKWHIERNEAVAVIEVPNNTDKLKTQLDSLLMELGLTSKYTRSATSDSSQRTLPDLSDIKNAKEALSLYQNLKNYPIIPNSQHHQQQMAS